FSSRRRHTSFSRDWSSDVCSSDLAAILRHEAVKERLERRRVPPAADIRELVEKARKGGGIGGPRRREKNAFARRRQQRLAAVERSEERRVGTEWTSAGCRGTVSHR